MTISCKVNAATSVHTCRECKTRMHGFCLVEAGTWGLCRKCYFLKRPSKITETAATKKKTTNLPLPIVISRSLAAKKNPVVVPTTASKKTADIIINPETPSLPSKDLSEKENNIFKIVMDKGVLVPPKPKVKLFYFNFFYVKLISYFLFFFHRNLTLLMSWNYSATNLWQWLPNSCGGCCVLWYRATLKYYLKLLKLKNQRQKETTVKRVHLL